jgi:hypothetical protein
MAESGVVLLAHGAAATNTMFQQHRSVLIEVFPYLRKRFGFMSVAQVIGNFYSTMPSTHPLPPPRARAHACTQGFALGRLH